MRAILVKASAAMAIAALTVCLCGCSSVDAQIEEARAMFEQNDVAGAIAILDDVKPSTEEQNAALSELYAEIEGACFEGTHFLKPEHVMGIIFDESGMGSYVFGEKELSVGCAEISPTPYGGSYSHYNFWIVSAIERPLPYDAYLGVVGEQYEMIDPKVHPELFYEWAVTEAGGKFKSTQPSAWQVYIDDQGNLLTYKYGGNGSHAYLEVTTLPAK